LEKIERFENGDVPLRQSPGEKTTSVGTYKGRNQNCVWLKPQTVAQIEFTEWTPDNHLRHSKFVGLREDKEPTKMVREN